MIIVQLAGGLGNQMFQYATGRRLAMTNGVPLKLDLSGYGLNGDSQAPGLEAFRRHVRLYEFRINAEQASPDEIARLRDSYTGNSRNLSRIVRQVRRVVPIFAWPSTHFNEKQYRFDPNVLELKPPCYLTGFWQSEKYFTDVKDRISEEFMPTNSSVLKYADQYIDELREQGGPVISVHVRRGELAVAQDKLKSTKGVFGPPTSIDYIHKAIACFEPESRFLIFSDSAADIEWCKNNIKAERLHFSEGHNDIEDMMLMRACDHNIIASTFSWWAAWLNPHSRRRVVSPSQWGHPGGVMVTDDLIPQDWTMI